MRFSIRFTLMYGLVLGLFAALVLLLFPSGGSVNPAGMLAVFAGLLGSSFLAHRWSLSLPKDLLPRGLRASLKGDLAELQRFFSHTEFAPLVKDLDKILRNFAQEKGAQRLVDVDLWTALRLRAQVRSQFGDSRLCVVANREPYIH